MLTASERQSQLATFPRKSFPPVKRGASFWLGLTAMILVMASTVGHVFDHIPVALHYSVVIPTYYFLAMCLHDAIHRAAHEKQFWNKIFGWLCAIFFGLTFPTIRRAHLRHHTSFDHDHEPDVESFIYHSSWALIPRLFVVNWKCYVELKHARLKERSLATLLVGGLLVWGCYFPHRVIFSWLIPMQFALAVFALMTVYLPHGRYSEFIMQHLPSLTGFHDDHHHRPHYPWYQYFSMRWSKIERS